MTTENTAIDQGRARAASAINSLSKLAALLGSWPGVVVMICCAAGLVSILLGIDNYWDLRFYHLYGAWAYLHDRYLYDIAPAQSQGFLNPTADYLFYALISSPLNDFPRLVAFVMGAVHGVNAVLVFAISRHVLRPVERFDRWMLAILALLMGASGAGFISLLGGTSNDLMNSMFVLASLLALLKAAERTGERGVWKGCALAGAFAGIAVGLKYTASIFMPELGAVLLIAAIKRRSIGAVVAFAVALLVGFLVVAGHHLLTLWLDFGNPVFPLLNHIFQSPYFDFDAIRDDQFIPRDVWQTLAYPFYWTTINRDVVTELPFRDWREAIAYVAIVAVLLSFAVRYLRGSRTPQPGEAPGFVLLLVFVIVDFFSWELSFGNYRYGVALELLTGVVTMGAVIRLFANRRLRLGVATALVALAASTTVYLNWGRVPFGDRYIDIRVPSLPKNSVVLLATWNPSAYFIPYAEPTARYLGIENDFLKLAQTNILASEVKRLMRTPGPPKFILSVGEFRAKELNDILGNFGLRLSATPCRPIQSNIAVEALALCAVTEPPAPAQ